MYKTHAKEMIKIIGKVGIKQAPARLQMPVKIVVNCRKIKQKMNWLIFKQCNFCISICISIRDTFYKLYINQYVIKIV